MPDEIQRLCALVCKFFFNKFLIFVLRDPSGRVIQLSGRELACMHKALVLKRGREGEILYIYIKKGAKDIALS